MENLKDMKVGHLVAEDYRFADVFKKHGIDFCCGGGISVEEACIKKNLDYEAVVNELAQVGQEKKALTDFNSWELDRLIDHIVSTHHTYVKENLPLLIEYSTKVARVHGDHHPEVIEVNKRIHDLAGELLPHLNKEEVVLFPYIKKVVDASRGGLNMVPAAFGTVQNPVKMMMIEHDAAGDIMKFVSVLTAGYTPPSDACATYRVLYQKLQEFENDLYEHIHLENNILFPKSIEMEAALQNA